MNNIEDAQAGLAEVAKRRNQAIDGASRGRHRGWDATGMLAMLAAFAALDLPGSSVLGLTLFSVGIVAALLCFTRAGRRSTVVMHKSQMTGRFWAAHGGMALAAGAVLFGVMWLVDQADIPLRNTLVGALFVAFMAITEPLYRLLLRRAMA
ncbi:hypothetical protein ACQPWY_23415 [Pseudonocardia xinjiangensis]|uniref:hypothetical protein n=1 Tax=Pseudonocardia xinjiangensis TaxID=75289 RepID=UPI003D8EC2E5